ncbi:MAG: hypothetical protein ACOYIR_06055 [Christensenellales bacterium]
MLFIYLKQSAIMNKGESVALRDVAQLAGVNAGIKQVKDVVLGTVGEEMLLITAADVAAALNREDVTFLGAPACAVQPRQKEDSRLVMYLKAVFVAILLFVGGAMTILTYQTDVDMPETHMVLSRIFTGSDDLSPWITLPYCAGVGIGVLFFTNILPGKKKSPSLFELEEFSAQSDQQKYDVAKAEEKK